MNDEVNTEVDAALPSLPGVSALPEGEVLEPPRPLVPGAFLDGEFEVKELLDRGIVNYYWADGGDYSQPIAFLLAERALPLATSETEESPTSLRASLMCPLFTNGRGFVQEGREYWVYHRQETTALAEWREPTNDARYLHVMRALLEAVCELEEKKLNAHLSTETLRFDERGTLQYFGFVDALPSHQTPANNLHSLQEVHQFLLKHTFAENSTMRLDDEWGGLALCEEVKAFASRLKSNAFATANEALQALPAERVLRAEAQLLSDVGQEREINEDAGMIVRLSRAGHLQSSEVELYAVADGMGGHEGGEVASDLTLNVLQLALFSRAALNWHDNLAARTALGQIIEEVNAAVVEMTDSPQYRTLRHKPGATLVCALRVGPTLFIGNVGDSRAYLWDAVHGLQAITKDHSYVQTLIDSGQLDPSQAWGHPEGSVITAHIGMAKLTQRDVFLRLAQPGAKLLLFSDGVMDMLRDEEIAPIVAAAASPAQVCRDLVDAANAAGGHDNITVVCVHFA